MTQAKFPAGLSGAAMLSVLISSGNLPADIVTKVGAGEHPIDAQIIQQIIGIALGCEDANATRVHVAQWRN